MRLYANTKGEWVGTQAEAKKIGASLIEVPTDKPSLLKFLNDFTGAIDVAAEQVMESKPVPQPNMKPHAWQTIRECAEKASLKDLGVALAVVMNRLDAATEGES